MKTYYLPTKLRPELRKIWGIPIFGRKKEIEKKFQIFLKKAEIKKIITIGDFCSLMLPSDVKVFDGKIKRKKVNLALCLKLSGKKNRQICSLFSSTPAKCGALKCANPAGTIQKEVWPILKKAIKKEENVFIEGEEDLLVIPAVLLSDKNTIVVYGYPNKGICVIEVSSKIKKIFKKLLKKFKTN